MSGAGRQHRAKHVTTCTLADKISDTSVVARVVGPRGGNLHELQSPTGSTSLGLLPAKFRKVMWFKKGDFVMVDNISEQPDPKGPKISGVISAVLTQGDVKELVKLGKFPQEFLPAEKTSAASDDLWGSGNPNHAHLHDVSEEEEEEEEEEC